MGIRVVNTIVILIVSPVSRHGTQALENRHYTGCAWPGYARRAQRNGRVAAVPETENQRLRLSWSGAWNPCVAGGCGRNRRRIFRRATAGTDQTEGSAQ
jgi:hypothetical protein